MQGYHKYMADIAKQFLEYPQYNYQDLSSPEKKNETKTRKDSRFQESKKNISPKYAFCIDNLWGISTVSENEYGPLT